MSLTLHYAPRTRSLTALWLLEELGQPYELNSFDIMTGHHRKAEHMALNPMGKVPVVVDGETPVSELGAIAIYLADRYPDAGLSPAIDAPERAAFLRWCFFSSAIIEPALGEKFFKWEVPSSQVAWGSFDRMLEALKLGLESGPWLLGDTFSAADVLIGAAVRFGIMFGAFDKEAPFTDYVARATARPAFQRAEAIEKREGERFPPAG